MPKQAAPSLAKRLSKAAAAGRVAKLALHLGALGAPRRLAQAGVNGGHRVGDGRSLALLLPEELRGGGAGEKEQGGLGQGAAPQ